MNIFYCEDRGYFLELPKIIEVFKNKLKNKSMTESVWFMWNALC